MGNKELLEKEARKLLGRTLVLPDGTKHVITEEDIKKVLRIAKESL